jgi:hypothetical protein
MTTIQKAKATAQKKKIVKKNAEFKRATPAEKRVMIAKDVIAALKQKTIYSQSGTWCSTRGPIFDDETLETYEKVYDTQISSVIKDVSCDVCALGALFVCGVRRFNKITFGKLSEEVFSGAEEGSFAQEHLEYFLKGYFSESQLSLIEIAFEKGYGGYFADDPKELLAKKMFKGTAKNRMIGIMNNIIKNKGKFVPA